MRQHGFPDARGYIGSLQPAKATLPLAVPIGGNCFAETLDPLSHLIFIAGRVAEHQSVCRLAVPVVL